MRGREEQEGEFGGYLKVPWGNIDTSGSGGREED